MFTNLSMTGVGILTLSVLWVAQWAGLVNFDQTQAAKLVQDGIEIVGFVLTVWGQLRRPDLTAGLWRKSTGRR